MTRSTADPYRGQVPRPASREAPVGDAASGEVGDRGVRAGVGVGPERVLAEGPMVRAIPSSPTSPQAVRTAPPRRAIPGRVVQLG
jgi:hypothetical protein